MRTTHIWTISVIILVLLGSAAAWRLREPLQAGLQLITSEVGGKPELRFAVVGDNHGNNPVYRQILKQIEHQPYDFLLNLADTSEFGRAEEFQAIKELESELSFPVYHTVGNHDIKADPSREVFRQIFGHGPNTRVELGSMRLLILDNAERKVGFSSETLDWVRREFEAAPEATFMLAYHRPFGLPLASLAGDDETKTSAASNAALRKIIQPYKVAYIFTAHLHTYIPYALDDIPAVVSGGGGDPAQSVLGGSKNNIFHYLDVEVRNGRPHVTVERVELES